MDVIFGSQEIRQSPIIQAARRFRLGKGYFPVRNFTLAKGEAGLAGTNLPFTA